MASLGNTDGHWAQPLQVPLRTLRTREGKCLAPGCRVSESGQHLGTAFVLAFS